MFTYSILQQTYAYYVEKLNVFKLRRYFCIKYLVLKLKYWKSFLISLKSPLSPNKNDFRNQFPAFFAPSPLPTLKKQNQ